VGAVDVILFGSDRTQRIIGQVPGEAEKLIEVLVSEEQLRAELFIYSRNIFILSLIIAAITSAVIFLFINRTLIGPIRRITENMIDFRRAPENATLIIGTSNRRDEIGIAERELAAMQSDLFSMLRHRRHLADLGLAVAKINHDLRNTLTSAQLLSDQVATPDDPNVQRLAPRLVHTLDKAIGFAQSVLDYGRQSSTPPRRQPVDLRALVNEAAFDAGVTNHPDITLENNVEDEVTLKVDPDQTARVFVNLLKNAREALESAGTRTEQPTISIGFVDRGDDGLAIVISDNGPGLPPRARENLFVAFEGSARAGGTGLGLSIARELAEAHGGTLEYMAPEQGTQFEIRLPRSARSI
jgi:signal transduction histidine kinase